jgi:hypothetical protein
MNNKGKFEYVVEGDSKVTIRCTEEFTVMVQKSGSKDKSIVGPNSSTDRLFVYVAGDLDTIICDTKGLSTTLVTPMSPRAETPLGRSLTVTVDDTEMTVADQVRLQVAQIMSQTADKHGYDTLEDEDDLDYEDDDEGFTPLTPYEYKEMSEQHLDYDPRIPDSDNKESVAEVDEVKRDDSTNDSALAETA